MSMELKSGRAEGSKEFWRSVFISVVMSRGCINNDDALVRSACSIADQAVEYAIERGAVCNDGYSRD